MTNPVTAETSGGMPLGDDGLSDMERKFCEAALTLIQSGEKFWRAKAADAAGYKDPPRAAHQLIRRARVVAYISGNLVEAAEEVKVDRSFVLFRALTQMAACEAAGDNRTALRYLDIIAKHTDVAAFTRNPEDPAGLAAAGRLSMPFDPSKLSTEELQSLVSIMRKAGSGEDAIAVPE